MAVWNLCAFALFARLTLAAPAQEWGPNDPSVIETSSGLVSPLIDSVYPDVYQYLGMPFAQPPLGQLRFAPPQPVHPSNGTIRSTMPPGCYQLTGAEDIFDVLEPGFGQQGQQSEDCLKLNLFRPMHPTTQSLPVLIFVYGGGFVQGGINETYEQPTPWVQAKQNLIVVNIQYRLNIFGFPNSAALQQNNLGLQDIRAAVEWVRDNVQAFGGDPSRITLWGQSAGSIATNAWTYSYLNDPIVSGTISTSGTALAPREGWQALDSAQNNFTFVAGKLGCFGDPASVLGCMRQQPAILIKDTLKNYTSSSMLSFQPVVDDQLVFSNYTELLREGHIIKQPAILGSNRREGERSIDKGLSTSGPNTTLALVYTVVAFLCPAQLTAKLRYEAGLPTYRYEYKGNFSNISPLPWMGAYHASPLPLLFGTTDIASAHPFNVTPSTAFEFREDDNDTGLRQELHETLNIDVDTREVEDTGGSGGEADQKGVEHSDEQKRESEEGSDGQSPDDAVTKMMFAGEKKNREAGTGSPCCHEDDTRGLAERFTGRLLRRFAFQVKYTADDGQY
ncbi:Liver carboxylesterase B-1 [Cyphellophora attinorum]|uniref:Carboxylic ester hydrolase n=1 Tax=Cyphellophora attinorum TaxID=1664694 RepID=A0A0N1H4C4_9EURO|nr:Liver carboxylesterase B-1 [Phialophora attinorum]KPI36837.1 Liver carboxylesterase B-1 [Phialophora attinorum]